MSATRPAQPPVPAARRGTPLRLAVEVDGAGHHPAAWRTAPGGGAGTFGPEHWEALGRLVDDADLDLLVVPDDFASAGAGDGVRRGRLDAVAVAAHLAPSTRRTGLVPVVTTTHTEPFHTQKAIATLDLVSGGRAGWQVGVSATEEEAAAFGRRPVAGAGELWEEAGETVDVARALWDSWEDDAVVRDTTTGRYLDRDKVHHVDHRGPRWSVRGPSITPRPPQGHPLVVVAVDGPESLAVAAARADVARITAADPAQAVERAARVRSAAGGRALTVLLDVEVLLRRDASAAAAVLADLDAVSALPARTLRHVGTAEGLTGLLARLAGVDGAVLVPLEVTGTLPLVAAGVVPALRDRGLRGPLTAPTTLRERFGLPRPANVHAGAAS